jgi:hypothetical protein
MTPHTGLSRISIRPNIQSCRFLMGAVDLRSNQQQESGEPETDRSSHGGLCTCATLWGKPPTMWYMYRHNPKGTSGKAEEDQLGHHGDDKQGRVFD